MILKYLLLLIGVTFAIMLWYISPIFKPFPQPTGDYAIGTLTMELKDPIRKELYSSNPDDIRNLMVRFWYPAQPSSKKYLYLADELPYFVPQVAQHYHIPQWIAKQMLSSISTHTFTDAPLALKQDKYPLVLFSHGLLDNTPSIMSLVIFENLASNGYIVVSIDHPYLSGLSVYPNHKVISPEALVVQFQKMSPQEQKEFQSQAIEIYKADMKFVIDQLAHLNGDPKSIFYKRLDLDRIGVMGHSAGGTAAIEFCRIDNRCKAAANLDGWYDHVIGHEPLKQPLLLMFGSKSIEVAEPTLDYLKRKELTREQYYERERKITEHKEELCKESQCSTIIIPGASHEDFSDLVLLKWPLRSWNEPNGYTIMASINKSILKFFDSYLKK